MILTIFGVTIDPLLVAACFAVGAISLWLLHLYAKGGWCYSKARLDGKTVVITGANTGIGKETARDLARRGARVILACRDVPKADKAAQEIREDTGSNNLAVYKLDLASLASIREFAEKINAEESRLDILINNAGIMMCPEWKTEDGFEMQFGVNHLGHFLLTNLLLDLIKSSSPARIVNVSSLGHLFSKMRWDDLNMRKKYNSGLAYAQSKLANVLFTKELSKRLKGTGVSAFSLHPGNVRTELTRHTGQLPNPVMRLIFFISSTPLGRLVLKTPLEGAQTSIHCAVAEGLENQSGLYFSDCAPKKPSSHALDEESARRLWELSAELVGLDKKLH